MINEIELWEQEIEYDIELQNVLREESIYNFYDEGVPVTESMETILEYTQKELLDPKFLDKMKNNRVKFNSTSAYISTILGIISAGLSVAAGIAAGGLGVIGGIAAMPWVGLFVGMNLYDAFTSLSAKTYYKHKDKYEKQFKQLKEKAKKAIENDKKNADKYKNILKQIEKIEKDKAEEAKRLENEAKKANLEYTIDRYRDAIDILKGKFQFEDLDLSGDICGGLYILDKYLKIPEKQIYDKMIKGCKVYTAEELYGKDEAHGMGFKSDTKLIPLSIDDDAIWVVDIAKKNILCIDYKYRHDSYNLYAFADNYKDDSYDIDEAIEEADKYLGYYKVAECPKAVVSRDLLDDKPVNESVEFIEEGFFDKFKKKKSTNNKVQSKKVEKYTPEEIKVLNKLCDDIIKFSNTKINSYIKNSKFRKGVLDYMKECDLEEEELPNRLVFEDFDGDIATGYFVMRIVDPSNDEGLEQELNIALNNIFRAIIEDIKLNPKFNKIADFNIGIGDGDEGCLYMGITLKKEESTNEDFIYNFYDTGSDEVVQEGSIKDKVRKFLSKKQKNKTGNTTSTPKKKEIDIEAFKKNYPTIMKIAKDSLKQAGNPKGFSLITSKDEQNYNDIVAGEDWGYYLCMISMDIYHFKESDENARDLEVNERMSAKCDEIIDILKKNGITEYGTVEYYGDWDEGPIALILK